MRSAPDMLCASSKDEFLVEGNQRQTDDEIEWIQPAA